MAIKWEGWSLGAVIALLVLIAVFVLFLTGKVTLMIALLIGFLALSRLV